ncbi:MAG: DivIVA domain-containing protein [Acutalibacteraceae bacterium]|nr:DivIVA domain-containing protein [Acutalibacteraceae bacterium]
MSSVNFNLEENGYNVEQVNQYIEMLQQEYENAVAWGEEMEAKYEKLKTDLTEQGICFTIDEDNQSEVVKEVFDKLTRTIEKVKADASARADAIVTQAKDEAAGIVRRAKENSVEIRTENMTIMKNLKSISEMIEVILEKGIQ